MYRKSRDEGFGPEVKRRILLGTYVLSAGYYDAYYRKAQQVRTLLTRDFLTAFAEVDAIVCPVTPTPAFKLGEKTDDPMARCTSKTSTRSPPRSPASAASASPAAPHAEGLPIGVQVLGKHFDESTMLRVSGARIPSV
jgi:aspartyl-tRNA(Asn)/glutamyl-tRNA(Gln) amidotransferase subunit A